MKQNMAFDKNSL